MSISRIPDDFSVWAFTDPHGMRDAFAAALRLADLTDEQDSWVAPAGTALVGCGDYIDRGPDSGGLLDLLFRLRDEAAGAGSLLVLCRGNHEEMLAGVLSGDDESMMIWLSRTAGGHASATSFGLSPDSRALGRSAADLARALTSLRPDLPRLLRTMPDAAIWRDVIFCHAGPVAGYAPADFGTRTTDHLWQSPAFHSADLAQFDLRHPNFDGYRAAGLGRFVYGHVSNAAPTTFQDGQLLCIETNATGGAPGMSSGGVTLARIPPVGSLADTTFVVVPTKETLGCGVEVGFQGVGTARLLAR